MSVDSNLSMIKIPILVDGLAEGCRCLTGAVSIVLGIPASNSGPESSGEHEASNRALIWLSKASVARLPMIGCRGSIIIYAPRNHD